VATGTGNRIVIGKRKYKEMF